MSATPDLATEPTLRGRVVILRPVRRGAEVVAPIPADEGAA